MKVNNHKLTTQSGFTIMEIVVATTIFAVVVASMMALFNYVLRTSRRAEALRQATQGMRSLVEFLVKEVRNGQIYYSVVNGTVVNPISPCYKPAANVGLQNNNGAAGDFATGRVYGNTIDVDRGADNRFALITADGDRECIYLADANNNPASGFTGTQLRINKNGVVDESLSPLYFTVSQALFYVRPLKDPYTINPAGSSPKEQPRVIMNLQFMVSLPTGEKVPIYYQTSVSSGKYDIPTQ